MDDMKSFIEEKIKNRKQIYLAENGVVARQDYARETEDWQSYQGRELLELLQNADDEITDNLPARVKITFHDNRLTVSNNGEPFSKDGIVSLMYSNVSPKRERKKEVIGNKGTGFRSVLGWAREIIICSGDLSIRFTKEYSQSCLDKLFADNEEAPKDINAAVLAFPEWIQRSEQSEYTTDISLLIKDDMSVRNNIYRQLNSLNGEMLLFLNRIKELIVETEERTRRFLRQEDGSIDCYEGDNLIDHQEWFMNRSDDNYYDGKKYSVVIAYKKTGEAPQRQVLYNYFPTMVDFPYPVLVHADFDVDSHRNHLLQHNEANRVILLKVADMLIDTAQKLHPGRASYSILEFLMPKANLPKELLDYGFESSINIKIRNANVFPTVGKEYVNFSDKLVYYQEGFAKFVSGNIFSTLLMYTENKTVEQFIKNSYSGQVFRVYTYPYWVECLNKWVGTLPRSKTTVKKVACCLAAIINEDISSYKTGLTDHDLKIFFNDDLEIVSNRHPVFLQKEHLEIPSPPKFAQIEFLHPLMVKVLKECVSKERLEEYLSYLNVQEYTMEDIISCMFSQIQSLLEKKAEKKAHRCAIEAIKWLWNTKKSLDTIKDALIYIPVQNGKLRVSNEVYFGEEYKNYVGFTILSAIDKDAFIMDFSNILHSDADNIVSFFSKFGVTNYPRIYKRRVSTYENRDYWEFVLDVLNYPYSQEENKYTYVFDDSKQFAQMISGALYVDYIDGLKKILSTCDTESIILWINNDKRLSEHVIGHVEPSPLSKVMVTWDTLRTERPIKGIKTPRSYIYYLFCVCKWIRVKGHSYGIQDCLLSMNEKDDLSPLLAAPDVNEYIKDIPQKKSKIRQDYISLFEKMGVKRDFAELSVEKIYSVLSLLSSKADSGNIATAFYSQMLDENTRIKKKLDPSRISAYKQFLKNGEVYCKDGRYHKISETYYVAGKDVCDTLLKKMNIMSLPRRRVNYGSVQDLFGVRRVQLKGVSLKKAILHDIDYKFQKDFQKYKALAFSYRIDAKRDIKSEARKFGGINIHLCEQVFLEYKNENVSLDPYDFFLVGSNDYYLSAPKSLNSIHSTQVGIAVSRIICSYLDVYDNESDYRELYNAGSNSDRIMILRESVDDATIQRAREAMSDKEDNRDDFINIIDKLSEKPIESVQELIDRIDYEDFVSIANISTIIELFRTLDIDVDVYNKEKPAISIDLSEYNRKKIEDTLPKYNEKYKLTLYNKCLKETIEEKKVFQSKVMAFNNVVIKYNNSVYFDVDKEIVSQLGIDLTCPDYDLNKIYQRNYTLFKKGIDENEKDKMSEFIQNPENGSLVYFGEFDELKKRFDDYISAEKRMTEEKARIITGSAEPIVVDIGETSPLTLEIKQKKTARKTGWGSSNKQKNLPEIGLRGETYVFQKLSKDSSKTCLKWMSENAQKMGENPEGSASYRYDMEYVDDKLGKCYVEVKASTASLEEGIFFHMSENEYQFACDNSSKYYIYYVASVNDKQPKIVCLGNVFADNEFNSINYNLSVKEYYISARCSTGKAELMQKTDENETSG